MIHTDDERGSENGIYHFHTHDGKKSIRER